MTLFRAEWKKLAGGKFLFLLLTLFAAAQGVLSYCLTPVDEYAEAYRKICSFAADDPEGFDRYYAELDAIRQEYDETISKMDPKTVRKANIPEPIYPCTVSGDPGLDDYALMNYYLRVTLRTEEIVGKELDRVIRVAVEHRDDLSGYDPVDPASFVYRKQLAIEEHYKKAKEGLTALPVYHAGWGAFFSGRFSGVFILLFLSALASYPFLIEQNGAGRVIRQTPKGRGRTAAAKLAVSALTAALAVLLLDGAALLGIWAKCGLSPLSESVQVFPELVHVPYALTVGKLLLLTELFRVLIAVSFCFILLAVSLLLRSRPLTFASGTVLTGAFFALYLFSGNENAAYLNPAGMFSTGDFLEKLRAVNFFRSPVDHITAAVFLASAFLIAGGATAAVLFSTVGVEPGTAGKRKPRVSAEAVRKRHAPRSFPLSLLPYEASKLVPEMGVGLLLAALIVVRLVSGSLSWQPTRDYDAAVYRRYLETLSGEITEEKREAILAEVTRIENVSNRKSTIHSDFYEGKITEEEYLAFAEEERYASDHATAAGMLKDAIDYHDLMLSETGKETALLYDLDWRQVFSQTPDWLLIVLSILLFTSIPCAEYARGGKEEPPAAVMKATKHGRGRLFRRKLLLTLLLSFALALLFFGADLFFALKNLRLPDGNLPAISVRYLENAPGGVTLNGLMTEMTLAKIAVTVLFALLCFCLGELIRNRIASMAAAVGIVALPALGGYFGVRAFSAVSIWDAFGFTDLYLNGRMIPFFIGLTALCVILTLLSGRKFRKQPI